MTQKYYYPRQWVIDRDVQAQEVIIDAGAELIAPEGKYLTMTVNGVGKPIVPGLYKGDVVITVADIYKMPPHGMMRRSGVIRDFHCAAVVTDGAVEPQYGVAAIVLDGEISGERAEHLYIASEEDSFNGILVTGDTKYEVNDSRIYLDGFGADDFSGIGAGVAVIDNARVTINDSVFRVNGVTRCAVHAGGDSEVVVNNCVISNHSPASDWVKDFSWQVGFSGTNRLCQLTDNAKVWYNNCDLRTNGWGVLSIDGTDEPVEMHIKDCTMELEGPRAHGYGAFCIGENYVEFDNSKVNVNGYPLLMRGMEGLGRADVKNGTVLSGRRFGIMGIGDDNSIINISDSAIRTDKSAIVMKGCASIFNISNSAIEAKNGVALQLMDNDEAGMNAADFKIPVGVVDQPVAGRDLSTASEELDLIMNLSDMSVTGDFLNSTTNIRARDLSTLGGMGRFHDTLIGIMPPPPPGVEMPVFGAAARHNGDDLCGPKNLGLRLSNANITGVVSSALQKYRDGLNLITLDNWEDLSNITQTPAPTVNNGVIVELDETSSWTVTGTSYITALHIAPGAVVAAAEGKTLTMTVDGAETPVAPGSYTGKIVLSIA